MIEHAREYEPATYEVIPDLIERGTHQEIMSVNAATRYWAACEAVFRLHHPRGLTRERFNLTERTILVHHSRRTHFMGYLSHDWRRVQIRYYAANAEACRSNWEIEYEAED